MTTTAPPVSVCLPAYNAERYVESAVRSVLDQTFADFELLILDDGSTDATPTILERLAASDRRIRFLSRPNAGLVPTLNELLGLARGEFIARMDADDLCRPERFERQVAYLRTQPECVAVGSRCLFIDPDGWPLMDKIPAASAHLEIESLLMDRRIGMLHPAVMIRKAAILQAGGGYRPTFPHVEDLDLFLRLAEVGQLVNLPEVLLEYRCHVHSVSHRHTAEQGAMAQRAVDAAIQRRGGHGAGESSSMPVAVAESAAQLHRKWAWWALGDGHVRSARKHARLAWWREPLASENVRLIATVLRDSVGGAR